MLPKKHLISWNVANDYAKVKDAHPAISIFNFHYARPAAVTDNYALNKVIGLNETGFKGTGDDYYRMQAWEFLLAGGGVYNNLDYSFCVGHEDGTFGVKAPTPGGGGPTLRRQLRVLAEFLRQFDLIRMKPAPELVKGGVPKSSMPSTFAAAGASICNSSCRQASTKAGGSTPPPANSISCRFSTTTVGSRA